MNGIRHLFVNPQRVVKVQKYQQVSKRLKNVRTYHASLRIGTWKTRMVPEMKESKPWLLEKGTPEYKEAVRNDLFWHNNVNTDTLAETISKDLAEGGTIRPGILDVLARKAHTVDHIRVMFQAMAWLQAKYRLEMKTHEATQLGGAAYRARSPESAIDIYTSPLIRIWPKAHSISRLIFYFVEEAERQIFKTPLPHQYELKANLPENYEETITVEKLNERFEKLSSFINDPKYELEIKDKLIHGIRSFYSLTGQMDKIASCSTIPVMELENVGFTLTGLISQGKFDEAKTLIESLTPDQLKVPKIAGRAAAVYFQLDEYEKAEQVLKGVDKFNPYALRSHMGKKKAYDIISTLYNSLVESGQVPDQKMARYKRILDKHFENVADEATE